MPAPDRFIQRLTPGADHDRRSGPHVSQLCAHSRDHVHDHAFRDGVACTLSLGFHFLSLATAVAECNTGSGTWKSGGATPEI